MLHEISKKDSKCQGQTDNPKDCLYIGMHLKTTDVILEEYGHQWRFHKLVSGHKEIFR